MKKSVILFPLLLLVTFSYSQTAKKLLKAGYSKFEKKDYQGAIVDYTKAIEFDSNFAEAYYNRGFTKNILKDYQGAIADYTKTIEIDSNSIDSYIDRGELKHILKDYQGAIADFTKAITLDLSDYEIYLKRGRVKYDTNDYVGAIKDFTQSIELNPYFKYNLGDLRTSNIDNTKPTSTGLNYADAYLYRGLAKNILKDYFGSIIDFTHVIEVNVHVFYSRYSAMDTKELYKQTGYTLPRFLLSEFVQKSWPNLTEAIYNRGVANINLQHYKEAVGDFTNVIILNPNYTNAYFYRGIANYELKEYYSSIARPVDDFTKAISLNPSFTNAYYHRGLVISKTSPTTDLNAISDFSKVIKLDSNFADAFFQKGFEMYKKGLILYSNAYSLEDIINNFTSAIKLKPIFADAYYHRGIAKSDFNKKDYKGAIVDYTKAIEQNPKFADAYYNRGKLYYKLQQNKEACMDMRKAEELGKPFVQDLIKAYCK